MTNQIIRRNKEYKYIYIYIYNYLINRKYFNNLNMNGNMTGTSFITDYTHPRT